MGAIKIIISAAGAAALFGCAPMEPRGIDVAASSRGEPVLGAKCVVSTPRGQWEIATPGAAPVGWAGRLEPLRVRCSKQGYADSELAITAAPHYFGPDPWAFDGPCAGGCRPGPWRNGIPGWTRVGADRWDGPYAEPDRWAFPGKANVEMTPQR